MGEYVEQYPYQQEGIAEAETKRNEKVCQKPEKGFSGINPPAKFTVQKKGRNKDDQDGQEDRQGLKSHQDLSF
jgi:hypothetical protein